MYRQVKYIIKIQPQPQKNLRKNINALYLVLISDKDSHRIFSQPILVDSDRQNQIYSTNDIEYNRVELWNYDKMKLIEEQKTAFGMCESFNFSCKAEEITYSITKSMMAKPNKMVEPVKGKQLVAQGLGSGRKNSEGQYQNSVKNKQDDCSNKTQSQEQSSRNTRNNKSPSIRIISAKQYHAY